MSKRRLIWILSFDSICRACLEENFYGLGWCVDNDINLIANLQYSLPQFGKSYTFHGAFSGTACASTLCGIAGVDCDVSRTGNVMGHLRRHDNVCHVQRRFGLRPGPRLVRGQ